MLTYRQSCWSGLVLLVVPLLAGCQNVIVGDWYLEKAVPSRDVFSIDNATFRGDGTFRATTTIEGLTTQEEGTYKFIGYRLTLRPNAGGQRAYTATLRGSQMELRSEKRSAFLRKGKRGS